MPLITVRDLVKTFRVSRTPTGAFGALIGLVRPDVITVRAVDELSFAIEEGEIAGYVGPNGAGKSTTIKMLTGILVPTSGEVRVAGLDPSRQRVTLAQRIGVVMGQRTQLWWDLPLADSLGLLRHIYRVPADRHAANLRRFTSLLDLEPFLRTPVRQLSLGQRMRGELTAALLHDPAVLYLDEPTIGLDVVAKARIRDFLLEINRERGVTIILTTNDTTDLERLCRRMLIVDQGKLVYDGPLEQVRAWYGGERTLVIDLDPESEAEGPLEAPGGVEVRAEGPRRWVRFRRHEVSAADLIAVIAARYRLRDLSIEEPPIEAIIRQIYEQGVPE